MDKLLKAFNSKKIFGYQYNITNLNVGNQKFLLQKEPKVLTGNDRWIKQEENIVDITIGGMPFIKKDPPKEKMALRQKSIKLFRKDQRKNLQDRRKSVRDGVIVSLSYKKDRRKRQDRRKSF